MDELHKHVVAFQHRCNDYIDDDSSSAAQELRREVQRFEDEVQVHKNPRSVENRVKQVIQLLHKTAEHSAMSEGHADELIDRCEDFRRELQKLF